MIAPGTASRPPLTLGRALIYAVLIAGAVIAVIPFIYMVTTSLKSYGSIITSNFWPWPPLGDEPPQFMNYGQAIRNTGWDASWGTWLFLRYFANSAIVSVCVVTGAILTSILAAYALAWMNLPGKNVIFLFILATIMVPPDLTLVPKVVMMFGLNWYNTFPALIIPFLASVFGIFLARQFFLQVPRDLFDAAVMDGAGHLRYLFSVALPLSRPAIVTIALLQFIWAWDEFRWPILVTRDSNMRTLSVGLQQYLVNEGGTNVHLLMALATIMVVPVLIAYFLTQKYFTEGFITSGIKG